MSNYKMKDIPLLERPRERMKQVGVSNLSDRELLAIILKTGTKDLSANDLAIEILKKYDLYAMKNLTESNLMTIKGIGEVKAQELISAIELGRRIYSSHNDNLLNLKNAEEIYLATKDLFYNKKQELFYCLYFDVKQNLIAKKLLFMGTINKSTVHPREIFKEAYLLSAASIICVHNHPSNDVLPSKADILLTENLIKTGNIQGIPVIDHIIVGDNTFYSFYNHKEILNL